MGTAVIAAIAALLGVVIGRLWDVRAESARWHRDQTMAAYQQLAEAFRAGYDDIQRIAFTDPTDPDYATAVRTIIVTGNHRWHDALTAVWLHGSPETITAAVALGRELTNLHTQAMTNHFTADQWALTRVASRGAFEEYLAAVRRTLGLAPVPDAFYNDTEPDTPTQ